jgi:hypothetical protein
MNKSVSEGSRQQPEGFDSIFKCASEIADMFASRPADERLKLFGVVAGICLAEFSFPYLPNDSDYDIWKAYFVEGVTVRLCKMLARHPTPPTAYAGSA